jgi:hypothetical protein
MDVLESQDVYMRAAGDRLRAFEPFAGPRDRRQWRKLEPATEGELDEAARTVVQGMRVIDGLEDFPDFEGDDVPPDVIQRVIDVNVGQMLEIWWQSSGSPTSRIPRNAGRCGGGCSRRWPTARS